MWRAIIDIAFPKFIVGFCCQFVTKCSENDFPKRVLRTLRKLLLGIDNNLNYYYIFHSFASRGHSFSKYVNRSFTFFTIPSYQT